MRGRGPPLMGQAAGQPVTLRPHLEPITLVGWERPLDGAVAPSSVDREVPRTPNQNPISDIVFWVKDLP